MYLLVTALLSHRTKSRTLITLFFIQNETFLHPCLYSQLPLPSTEGPTRRTRGQGVILSVKISSLADFLRCFGIIIIIIHQPKVPRGVILSVKISRSVDILRCFDIALLCYAVLCQTQDIEFMWAKHQI